MNGEPSFDYVKGWTAGVAFERRRVLDIFDKFERRSAIRRDLPLLNTLRRRVSIQAITGGKEKGE